MLRLDNEMTARAGRRVPGRSPVARDARSDVGLV
jgi:hypothetical protein